MYTISTIPSSHPLCFQGVSLKIGFHLTALLFLLSAALPAAYCQGNSTDVRPLQLYAFGGATGTYTGIEGGKNLGVTAGIDLGIGGYHGFLPTLEVRGTYPFDSGTIAGERDFLGGLKVERQYRAFHPYVDVLFGRGQIYYDGNGVLNPTYTILYQRSNSNLLAFGGGVDLDISPSFAIKADVQLQRWNVPVTVSGKADAVPITIGVLYRFGYRNSRPE